MPASANSKFSTTPLAADQYASVRTRVGGWSTHSAMNAQSTSSARAKMLHHGRKEVGAERAGRSVGHGVEHSLHAAKPGHVGVESDHAVRRAAFVTNRDPTRQHMAHAAVLVHEAHLLVEARFGSVQMPCQGMHQRALRSSGAHVPSRPVCCSPAMADFCLSMDLLRVGRGWMSGALRSRLQSPWRAGRRLRGGDLRCSIVGAATSGEQGEGEAERGHQQRPAVVHGCLQNGGGVRW